MKIKIFCRNFFFPGRAKDLSAPLYLVDDLLVKFWRNSHSTAV
jgi:hypothetical protein